MAVNIIECKNLGEAKGQILKDHIPNRWLYRGQTYRRKLHQIKDRNLTFEHENLYPQSFRFAANYTSISQEYTEHWQKEYAKNEALFNAFNIFLISKYEESQREKIDSFRWMEPFFDELRLIFQNEGPSIFSGFHEKNIGIKNPEFIRLSWSLAQHYGIVTALLDLTFDPDIAVWFATNLWDALPEPKPLEGNGIIYRFDLEILDGAVTEYNEYDLDECANIFKTPPNKAFVQDLRHIPTVFALRPPQQKAAVVAGFDTFRFIQRVEATGKMDAFVFPHSEKQLSTWPSKYSREYLIPPDDPFLDLKDEFNLKWKQIVELIGIKITKPTVILTDKGPKFANLPDELVDQQNEAFRERLYKSGMELLGSDLNEAEIKFQTVIKMGNKEVADRLTSHSYARIAVIRLLDRDFVGTAEALWRALDGPDLYPGYSWVGQLLQTIAQGAKKIIDQGQGSLVLQVLKRLISIAQRSGPQEYIMEAELGATVSVGEIEINQGNIELGISYLDNIAKRQLSGLTDPERSWVAVATQDLAKIYEAYGEKDRARNYYQDIVRQFGSDNWPDIIRVVEYARANL